ncbi:MAG: hypothetical protein EOP04_20660, partial [Proteobacteria bacterium]
MKMPVFFTVFCFISFSSISHSLTCEANLALAVSNGQSGCVNSPSAPNCTRTAMTKLYGTQPNFGITVSCRVLCPGVDYEYGMMAQGFCATNANPVATVPSFRSQWPSLQCGSIVHVENQTVGETVPIVGSTFAMNYFSNWTPGKAADYKVVIPIAANPVRDDINSFDISVKDGSTTLFSTSYVNNTPNVTFAYHWNGLDLASSPTLGTYKLDVSVTEH